MEKEIDIDEAFDSAFDSFGMETENIASTGDKLRVEAKDNGIETFGVENRSKDRGKLFYGLTDYDRQQAVDEFIVPMAYKNATFDIDAIKQNLKAQWIKHGKIDTVHKFKQYTQVCNEILSCVRMKMLPQRSYLIGAPNGFGKTSFVNECLITLRKQGYRVVPYISLWELAQLRVENEQRIMRPYKTFTVSDTDKGEKVLYHEPKRLDKDTKFDKRPEIVTGRFSYSEYVNADCLFVHFSDISSKEIESHALYQVLSIRGSKGLPTIVMLSTSLKAYEADAKLKEYIWNEIVACDERKNCFDRVYHVSCYKLRDIESKMSTKNKLDKDTGIVD